MSRSSYWNKALYQSDWQQPNYFRVWVWGLISHPKLRFIIRIVLQLYHTISSVHTFCRYNFWIYLQISNDVVVQHVSWQRFLSPNCCTLWWYMYTSVKEHMTSIMNKFFQRMTIVERGQLTIVNSYLSAGNTNVYNMWIK